MLCRALLIAAAISSLACDLAADTPAAGLPDPGPAATALSVVTEPPGATVTVDNVNVGQGPVTVQVRPGPHRVQAMMSGYYPAPEVRVVVERGVPASARVQLVASH
jgi:hypothetical protein